EEHPAGERRDPRLALGVDLIGRIAGHMVVVVRPGEEESHRDARRRERRMIARAIALRAERELEAEAIGGLLRDGLPVARGGGAVDEELAFAQAADHVGVDHGGY